MLYTKVKNDTAVEYPLSYEEVCERIIDPVGRSRMPIDLDYLASEGYYPVIPHHYPEVAPTSIVTMGLPILANGEWHENYLIRELSEQEKAENYEAKSFEVRNARNAILKATVDNMNPMRWNEFTDIEKQAWSEYRQALLDIPTQEGFPWNVEWPVLPA